MINKELLELLSKLYFFNHLSNDELVLLSNFSDISSFDENEVLFYEKDRKNKIYYLLEGELKMYKIDRFDNEIFLYCLNECALVTDYIDVSNLSLKECYANGVFSKKSKVLCVDFEVFSKLLKKDIKLYKNFIKECKTRLERLECVITRDVVFDGTAKVAFELANNLDKFNSLKKHEIAYMLHVQPETLSRILAKMARNELIRIEKNDVIVINKSALKEIYE